MDFDERSFGSGDLVNFGRRHAHDDEDERVHGLLAVLGRRVGRVQVRRKYSLQHFLVVPGKKTPNLLSLSLSGFRLTRSLLVTFVSQN
jgi:hypothetical protein